MVLACDIGNTNSKFAVFENNKRISFHIFPSENIRYGLLSKLKISQAAISSVVPVKTEKLIKYFKTEFSINPLIINYNSKFNLSINYKNPDTLGIDRICAAEGALKLYSEDYPVLSELEKFYLMVIDLGTATTINFINYKSEFEGGIILPGIKMMINSLNENTAQLPKIDLNNYTTFIGKDTRSSIASGILNSTVSLIEKAYNYLTNTAGAKVVKIYLTGGNANVVQPFIRFENKLVEDLVLQGVKAVFERNKIG
jgi:type III pantothenate kinase